MSKGALHTSDTGTRNSRVLNSLFAMTKGSNNAYTVTIPEVQDLNSSFMFVAYANSPNTDAATTTVNINSLGAKNLYSDSGPITTNDLRSEAPYAYYYNAVVDRVYFLGSNFSSGAYLGDEIELSIITAMQTLSGNL